MDPLRVAVIGCGFWSQFQIPAWLELPDVECTAVCDIEPDRAKSIADLFHVPKHFRDPGELFRIAHPDVVDVITIPETHRDLVEQAARQGIPVIARNPWPLILRRHGNVAICSKAGVPLLFTKTGAATPIRQIKRILNSGLIGSLSGIS
jgi:homoserine dehydrogenase